MNIKNFTFINICCLLLLQTALFAGSINEPFGNNNYAAEGFYAPVVMPSGGCDYVEGNAIPLTANNVNTSASYATIFLYGTAGGNFTGSIAGTISGNDATASLTGLTAGDYTFYAINYKIDEFDGTPNAAINETNYANLAAITATGACIASMQFDAMVCAEVNDCSNPAQECSSPARINLADPGTFNTSAGYIMTYVVTDASGLILQNSTMGEFITGTGTNELSAAGSPYNVYAINYNSNDATVPAITPGTTNINELFTAGTGGSCIIVSGTPPPGGIPALQLCVESCCMITTVSLDTDGMCSGDNATFTVSFDAMGASGNYEIYATATNANYGITIGDVLGTITSAAATGTGLTITGTVSGPTTPASTISVDVRDTGDNTCNGGTPITVNIPECPCPTATVTSTATVCNVATETGNDEGQEDLDALITAGDMTGTWTIVSGNGGGTATITGTMAGSDVVLDAGTEAGPIVVRYTLTGTAPCPDVMYDVTITRFECGVCAPAVGITRSN